MSNTCDSGCGSCVVSATLFKEILDLPLALTAKALHQDESFSRVVFKLVYRPGCQANVDDSMTINRISVGKRTLMFSFYFNFDINVLTNFGKE